MASERHRCAGALKRLEEAEGSIAKLRTEMRQKEKLIHRSHIYAHRLAGAGAGQNRSTPNMMVMSGSASMVSLSHADNNSSVATDATTTTDSNATKIIAVGDRTGRLAVPEATAVTAAAQEPKKDQAKLKTKDNER